MDYENTLYLREAVDEVLLRGEFGFDESNVDHLIRAVNELTWKEPSKSLPEAMPRYHGRKVIPCLVAVKSRPNRKPRVTVCQRRWNSWFERWEWSRNLNVILWREVPEV